MIRRGGRGPEKPRGRTPEQRAPQSLPLTVSRGAGDPPALSQPVCHDAVLLGPAARPALPRPPRAGGRRGQEPPGGVLPRAWLLSLPGGSLLALRAKLLGGADRAGDGRLPELRAALPAGGAVVPAN